MNRKFRMGIIGGGKDAFIGAIHRDAANLDSTIELVCGALRFNHEIATDSAQALFLPVERSYLTYQDMLVKDCDQPRIRKMDFVTSVTPNCAYFTPAGLRESARRTLLGKRWITLRLMTA